MDGSYFVIKYTYHNESFPHKRLSFDHLTPRDLHELVCLSNYFWSYGKGIVGMISRLKKTPLNISNTSPEYSLMIFNFSLHKDPMQIGEFNFLIMLTEAHNFFLCSTLLSAAQSELRI